MREDDGGDGSHSAIIAAPALDDNSIITGLSSGAKPRGGM